MKLSLDSQKDSKSRMRRGISFSSSRRDLLTKSPREKEEGVGGEAEMVSGIIFLFNESILVAEKVWCFIQFRNRETSQ